MKGSTILVTGGAGYIGSHAVLALVEAGHRVIVIDNLVYGHRSAVPSSVRFVEGDIGDRRLIAGVFASERVDVVMHFSAYAFVGESVTNPSKYYGNNVAATLSLLDSMVDADVKRFVFSSTCATFGIPARIPIPEDIPQHPINPYGMTKLMVERILKDYDTAYGLKSVVFRYFNAAGCDPEGRIGEDHDPETHLIPLVLQTALGQRESISVFGTDYDTADGTCIRDYIHVCDLADAHILGMDYLLSGNSSNDFNLGNGLGTSVREIIETSRRVTGREIREVEAPRREGDPPMLVGASEKARHILGWKPRHADIETIIRHAWSWHGSRPRGYADK